MLLVLKRIVGFAEVPYRGLLKNGQRRFMACAVVNASRYVGSCCARYRVWCLCDRAKFLANGKESTIEGPILMTTDEKPSASAVIVNRQTLPSLGVGALDDQL